MAGKSAIYAASLVPCRFVFNKALAMQKENHEAGNKFIGYVAMAKLQAIELDVRCTKG